MCVYVCVFSFRGIYIFICVCACVCASTKSDVCQYPLDVCSLFQEQQLREVEDRIDVLTVCMHVCVYAVT